jgi:hypothetical protein
LLVLLPLLFDFLVFVRRQFLQFLIFFPRCLALLGRELDPLLHALLQVLLRPRLHLGIAVSDRHPLLAPGGVQLIPLRHQRRENLLLRRGQLRPGGLGGLFGIGFTLNLRGSEGEGKT